MLPPTWLKWLRAIVWLKAGLVCDWWCYCTVENILPGLFPLVKLPSLSSAPGDSDVIRFCLVLFPLFTLDAANAFLALWNCWLLLGETACAEATPDWISRLRREPPLTLVTEEDCA